jgi:hypothetical protein
MKISVSHTVEIDRDEIKRIFYEHLSTLSEDRWIRDGKMWHEVATTHKFDMICGIKHTQTSR